MPFLCPTQSKPSVRAQFICDAPVRTSKPSQSLFSDPGPGVGPTELNSCHGWPTANGDNVVVAWFVTSLATVLSTPAKASCLEEIRAHPLRHQFFCASALCAWSSLASRVQDKILLRVRGRDFHVEFYAQQSWTNTDLAWIMICIHLNAISGFPCLQVYGYGLVSGVGGLPSAYWLGQPFIIHEIGRIFQQGSLVHCRGPYMAPSFHAQDSRDARATKAMERLKHEEKRAHRSASTPKPPIKPYIRFGDGDGRT